jgi:hypothetical protein
LVRPYVHPKGNAPGKGVDYLSVGGIDERKLVEDYDHGQPIRSDAPPAEEPPTLVRVRSMELYRHPAAGPQVLDLVRSRRPPLADDAQCHEAGAVYARPLVQKLRYDPVECLVGGAPRLDYVVVDLSERRRAQARFPMVLSPCETSNARLAPG